MHLMMGNRRGSITVFISIVLSSVFLVIGTFTDAARIHLAHSQVQRSSKTALSSLLACYNNELKNEYGLFGLYVDPNSLVEEYEEYLNKNLKFYNNLNFLYDYCVKDTKISQLYSLEDQDVFESQIMEFMKYRAPYELATDLAEKIEGIRNVSKGAKTYKRKMETDKKASEIGDLQLNLDNKTQEVNSSKLQSELVDLKSKYVEQNTRQSECNQELNRLQTLLTKEKNQKKKQEILKDINRMQEDMSNIDKTKDELKGTILDSVIKYKSINSQAIDTAKTISDKKADLLVRIDEEIEYTQDNADGIKELQKAYKDSLTSMKNKVNKDNSEGVLESFSSNISRCDSVIEKAKQGETDFLETLDELTNSDKIGYSFSKQEPVQSNDKDNREDVIYALKEAFGKRDELNTISDSLLKELPSQRKIFSEERELISWNHLDLYDESCTISNLEYLTEKENKFEEMATKVGEELFLNQYIMGTFKHDVPRLRGEDENNSFNLRSKDKTKRDAYFSNFEVEYIINGNRSEAANALLIKSEILAIRLISNVIHIYTDSSKMTRVSSLAAALSTWNAGLSTPLVQTMLVFSWAMVESLYDMDQLAKGDKILLFKTKEQWKTDMSGDLLQKDTPQVENNPLCLSYHDYLKVFLLLTDKEKKLARIQDLVQLNIGVSNSGLMLKDCKTYVEAETTVSIKNMFISFPNISRTDIYEKMFLGY